MRHLTVDQSKSQLHAEQATAKVTDLTEFRCAIETLTGKQVQSIRLHNAGANKFAVDVEYNDGKRSSFAYEGRPKPLDLAANTESEDKMKNNERVKTLLQAALKALEVKAASGAIHILKDKTGKCYCPQGHKVDPSSKISLRDYVKKWSHASATGAKRPGNICNLCDYNARDDFNELLYKRAYSSVNEALADVSSEPYKRALDRIKSLKSRGQDPIEGTKRRLNATEDPGKIQGIYHACDRMSLLSKGLDVGRWERIKKLASEKYKDIVGQPVPRNWGNYLYKVKKS